MKTPKTPKGRTTKKNILDASIELINNKGFDHVTLNDICRASDVATGTFYHYFNSTQAVLLEILVMEGEEIQKYYEGLKKENPLKQLRLLLAYQIEYFEKKGKEVVARIYSMELNNRQGTARLLKALPIMNLVEKVLLEAQEAGELKPDLNINYCTMTLLSLILGYSFFWLSSEEQGTLKDISFNHLMAEVQRMSI